MRNIELRILLNPSPKHKAALHPKGQIGTGAEGWPITKNHLDHHSTLCLLKGLRWEKVSKSPIGTTEFHKSQSKFPLVHSSNSSLWKYLGLTLYLAISNPGLVDRLYWSSCSYLSSPSPKSKVPKSRPKGLGLTQKSHGPPPYVQLRHPPLA